MPVFTELLLVEICSIPI